MVWHRLEEIEALDVVATLVEEEPRLLGLVDALGYDLAYGKLPDGKPVVLGQSYVDAARTCAEKRIALAGYRIAALLNRFLDPSGK